MSDDDQEKTEEPTQKKLDDARKKGQVANSREVSNFFMILAFTISVIMLFPGILRGGVETMGKYIAQSHNISTDGGKIWDVTQMMALDSMSLIIMPMLLLVVAALAASLMQNGFMISLESIKPKLEKISLKKGMKRMFSMRSFMEFLKGILKIAIVATIAFVAVYGDIDELRNVAQLNASDLMMFIGALAIKILIGVTVTVFLMAILDFIYQKSEHIKQLKMSKQDIKDEYKQQEGDPVIKGKLRQLRMERAQQRMMQSVPDANVVITNPTHYAVALKYDDTMAAPLVLAMGVDKVAERIKEVAEENEVPQVRNAPLARILYDEGGINQEIPIEHYQAVAEVISYIYKTKGKK